MRIIAASLTRAQATAVRKRIESLNEAIKTRNDESSRSSFNKLASRGGRNRQGRQDVRGIFPVQTVGQPTAITSTLVDQFERHTQPVGASSVKQTAKGFKQDYHGQRYVLLIFL